MQPLAVASPYISIHSLVKRETANGIHLNVQEMNFNPLPRKEGDVDLHKYNNNSYADFNPLPRKEGDAASHIRI